MKAYHVNSQAIYDIYSNTKLYKDRTSQMNL